MNISIFDYLAIQPFKIFGLTGAFWTVHLDTLLYTWAAMAGLFIIALVGRRVLQRNNSLSLLSLIYERVIVFFLDLCRESFGIVNYDYFYFIMTLFLFSFSCCLIALIPFLDEATKDLNTTLAISLISFFYVQYQKMRVLGIKEYGREFITPFFLLAPINIVGELAKIASMSFRLFGNILGGSIIFSMVLQLVNGYNHIFLIYMMVVLFLQFIAKNIKFIGQHQASLQFINRLTFILFLLVWAQIFFGIFEGLIQSFVLTMLTITYLATGIAGHTPNHQAKKDPA